MYPALKQPDWSFKVDCIIALDLFGISLRNYSSLKQTD